MRINQDTKYIDIFSLTDCFEIGEEARLMVTAEHYFKLGGWWSLTIGEFINMINGDFETLGIEKDAKMENLTAFQFYALKSFKMFVDDFIKINENLKVPTSTKEKQAEKACREMTIAEGLLVFARQYFEHKNFDESASLPLSDYLLAKKDNFNNAMYQRAITAQYNKK